MAQEKIALSIIIGALNEEARIGATMQALHDFLALHKLLATTELVIVAADGGDNTVQVVRSHAKLFTHFQLVCPGRPVGKGRDIGLGMLAAKGELRLFMDADLATPLPHILQIIKEWQEHQTDIIIGVRHMRSIHTSRYRQFISYIGNICFFFAGGFYVQDTQCGFKAFSAPAASQCFAQLTRLSWSFDMELLTIARANKLRIAHLDIPDWIDQPGGTFSGSLSDSWQFLKDLVRIFQYRVTGKYKF